MDCERSRSAGPAGLDLERPLLDILLVLFALAMMGVALFFFLRSTELSVQLRKAAKAWDQKEEGYVSELEKLDKLRRIPDIIERARRSKQDVEAKLEQARKRADEIVEQATAEAREQGRKLREAAEGQFARMREAGRLLEEEASALKDEAQQALRNAKAQASGIVGEAESQARSLASKARKEAGEKRAQADAAWTLEAEASQYRETLALEQDMKTDQGLKSRWLDEQASFEFADEDEDSNAVDQELEEVEA